MRKFLLSVCSLLLLQATNANAGDLGINVVLSGEVAPGVYGQVELGNRPPPAVVYASPVIIRAEPRYARAVSEESEPEYQREHHYHDDDDDDQGHDHGHKDHGHGKGKGKH